MSKRTVIAEETETEVLAKSPTEPAPAPTLDLSPADIVANLERLQADLAVKGTVRAEWDQARLSVDNALEWARRALSTEPVIAKETSIPAGT